jgi:hypothetical protein
VLCLPWMAFNEEEEHMNRYTLMEVTWGHEWELIRQWRNSQVAILRQDRSIPTEEQEKYAEGYRMERELALPPQVLYMFGDGYLPIAYGGLVHIEWEGPKAEVSFLMDPARKIDLLKYTTEWLTFLCLLRDKSKSFGIKTWRSETPFSTDPTRRIHVEVIRQLFKPREDVLKHSIIQEWEI